MIASLGPAVAPSAAVPAATASASGEGGGRPGGAAPDRRRWRSHSAVTASPATASTATTAPSRKAAPAWFAAAAGPVSRGTTGSSGTSGVTRWPPRRPRSAITRAATGRAIRARAASVTRARTHHGPTGSRALVTSSSGRRRRLISSASTPARTRHAAVTKAAPPMKVTGSAPATSIPAVDRWVIPRAAEPRAARASRMITPARRTAGPPGLGSRR